MTPRTEIISLEVPTPRGHFAHAVRAGPTIYVSGLLALNADGAIVHPGDAGEQTAHIMRALDTILQASGATRSEVVKLTIYVTDLADRVAVGNARAEFFGELRPASTLVEVAGLAADGARVEIEAIAVAEPHDAGTSR